MLVAALLDLVLPESCAGCGKPGRLLCPACAGGLAAAAAPVTPRPAPVGFPPCRAVAAYDDPVRSMLIAYKERRRGQLARPLGAALARAVAAHPDVETVGAVMLVPIPSQAVAVRRRGVDTTARLAVAAAAALRTHGLCVRVRPVLRLARPTADSAGLGAPDRQANLSHAMRVDWAHDRPDDRPGPPAWVYVLVDDLVTTGATLAEAARALAVAGRPGSLAAVVAATVRRSAVR